MKKLNILLLSLLLGSVNVFSQVPVLSSDVTASPVIFIDFDGHLVNNTAWNYDGPIACGASGLATAQMQEIFTRVAEDYRPFLVNVTTDSTKFLAAPLNKRVRVLVTTTWQWYGSTGGVSFIGSFTWGDDTPCFVFSLLLNFNTKFIAEAISHEAGHTLGLEHQSTYNASCVKTSEYNYGTGSGEIGWAPIMGAAYYQNVSTWYTGPNTVGCSSIQNDLAVITSAANGILYRTDDNANTQAAAKLLTITNKQFSGTGIFEKTNDIDLFKIVIPSLSTVSILAKPSSTGTGNSGANSDILVELLNSSLTLIGQKNPFDSLQAKIDTSLNAGTYFIRLKPVANNYASTYGMLGAYGVNGSVTALSTLPVHQLDLSGNNLNGEHILNWNIVADETIREVLIERSTNGADFSQLSTSVLAAGNYKYRPGISGVIYYRIRVMLDNGIIHYSRIISLKGSDEKKSPKLIANPVLDKTIQVEGVNGYVYTVFDLAGRQVMRGKLTDGVNRISVSSFSGGLYLLQFSGENIKAETVKMIIP